MIRGGGALKAGEDVGKVMGSIHLCSQVSLRSDCRSRVGRVRFETAFWLNKVELPSYIMLNSHYIQT